MFLKSPHDHPVWGDFPISAFTSRLSEWTLRGMGHVSLTYPCCLEKYLIEGSQFVEWPHKYMNEQMSEYLLK